VAPVHAEIFQRRGVVWLKALEKGVLLRDVPLEEGDSEPLSHGTTFTIGNTIFTYVEKDY
jgi:predicted component of type VI protein secretion system